MIHVAKNLAPFRLAVRHFGTENVKSVIFTWGVGSDGQLGHEKFETSKDFFFNDKYIQDTPRRMLNSSMITQVACGETFSIGTTQDAKLLGWGKGYVNGDETISKTPKLISPDIKVSQISAGIKHAAAIDTEGKVYTWSKDSKGLMGNAGKNSGELGHGTTELNLLPKSVQAFIDANIKISSVSCGEAHTVFLSTDGEVFACGNSDNGRLGTNNKDQHELRPVSLDAKAFNNEQIIQVCAGCTHTIALTASGVVYAWGRNEKGQLGMGSDYLDMHSMEWEPQLLPKSLFDNQKVVKIAAGKDRCAAITSTGILYTWGNKFMHYPQVLSHPHYDKETVVDVVFAGRDCVAYITSNHHLYTAGGSTSSSVLGRPSGMFDERIQRVAGLDNRKVLNVFAGFGLHMAARVTSIVE